MLTHKWLYIHFWSEYMYISNLHVHYGACEIALKARRALHECMPVIGEVYVSLYVWRGHSSAFPQTGPFPQSRRTRAYSCSAEALGKWWAGVARALGGGRIMEILGGECCRVLALVRVCNIPSFGTRHLLGAHVYAKAQILAYTECENYSNHPSSSICTRAQPLDTRSRPAYFIKHYN